MAKLLGPHNVTTVHDNIKPKNQFALKTITTIIFLWVFLPGFTQEDSTEYIFTGQILDPDSLPVENVYLINYRNVKAYATNKYGKFKIPVLPGDSLKTSHISYESIIVKACPPDSFPVYRLSFAINNLGESYVLRYRNLGREKYELENFNRNWDIVMKSMQAQGCFVSRGPKRPMPQDGLVRTFGMGGMGGGNANLALSPEAIYYKIKRMSYLRKAKRQKKKGK